MPLLSGILAPVVSTFDAHGELDGAAFADNVRAHLAAGLHGILVAGSTGEAPLLDDVERARLVEIAREAVPRDRTLLAGVGAESTRETIRRARTAAERGADAVLVVAPHYYGGAAASPMALHAHYTRVADDSPVPVVLYNIPKYMHFALPSEVVGELAEHGNIAGIKDSSGDEASLAGYLAAQSERFTVLTGSGSGLAAALGAGARGGILAVSLFAPRLTLAVLERYRADDEDGAGEAQAALVPLAREIVGALGVPGVKEALDQVELRGGLPRLPLPPLAAPDVARVAALLANAGIPTAG